MSSTMVYSMVYQMVTDPQKYVGKRIKMKGAFSSYFDEEANQRFFGCVIKDALACCSQGLAFELAKPRKFPSEYPSEGTSITIIGTFEFEKVEGKSRRRHRFPNNQRRQNFQIRFHPYKG